MANILGSLRTSWRIRNTRRELSRLTDAQLNDIGILRGQIDDFARSMTGGRARRDSF